MVEEEFVDLGIKWRTWKRMDFPVKDGDGNHIAGDGDRDGDGVLLRWW